MSPKELRNFLDTLLVQQAHAPTEYRAGYCDALKYIADWMDETEDE